MVIASLLLFFLTSLNLYSNSETTLMIKQARDEQNKIIQDRETRIARSTTELGESNWYKTNEVLHITSGTLIAILLFLTRQHNSRVTDAEKAHIETSHWALFVLAFKFMAGGYAAITVPVNMWNLFNSVNNDYMLKVAISEFDKKYEDLKKYIGFLESNNPKAWIDVTSHTIFADEEKKTHDRTVTSTLASNSPEPPAQDLFQPVIASIESIPIVRAVAEPPIIETETIPITETPPAIIPEVAIILEIPPIPEPVLLPLPPELPIEVPAVAEILIIEPVLPVIVEIPAEPQPDLVPEPPAIVSSDAIIDDILRNAL